MAQYDANKNYSWSPEDKFELSGQEFGLLLNVVRAYMVSEEAGKFRSMLEASKSLENILSKGVESGVIKEQFSEQHGKDIPQMNIAE